MRYITEVKKVVENINGSSETHKENQPYTAKDVSTTKYSIRDLHAFVKKYDSEFKPNPANLAFLNDDGTPMVMYHGTNSNFTSFDKRRTRVGAFGKGFYFAPSESRAKAYGSAQIMETYLSIKMDSSSLSFLRMTP